MEKSVTAEKQNDYSKGSITRHIVNIGLPMTAAQLINILYNLVDRMYLGHIPGEGSLALTGVGLTLPLITLISAFSQLCGNGGAPLCSIYRGMGHDDEAEKVMGNSLTLLLICGVAVTVLGLVFCRPLLYFFGASDVTYEYARDYIVIYLLGSVFVMLGLGMNSYINAQGFGKMGMVTVSLGAVINIALDPVFIFVFDMGVKGAALATIISQFASAVWVMAFLMGKKTILKLRLENMRLQAQRVKKIMSMGAMGFVMACTNSLVQTVANNTLQLFGGDLYVGVMTIISSIREVALMPLSGFNSGSQPVMGYNYGAKEYGRVCQCIKFCVVTGIIYSTVFCAVTMAIPDLLIKIYNSEPDILAAGVPSVRMYFACFFMMGFQMSGQSTFVALGKSKQAIFFSMLRKAFIVAPLTLILPRLGMGVNGVFVAEMISDVVGSSACILTMYFTVWKNMKRRQLTSVSF